MKVSLKIAASRKRWALVLVVLVAILPFFANRVSDVAAQAGDDVWTTPVNLSNSGAASDPLMVVDSDGNFKMIWKDEYAGIVYTQGDGTQWAEPKTVEAPFADYRPLLIPDPEGFIHAFWIEPGARQGDSLYYSGVKNDFFSTYSAWSYPLKIGGNASAVSADIDQGGRLHAVFLQLEDNEDRFAGIYYLNSFPGGRGWNTPKPLYQSAYFRTVDPNDAHLVLDSTVISPTATTSESPANDAQSQASTRLYVAWDNPALQRIFMAISPDGGENWNEPLVVAEPSPASISGGPGNVTMRARGEDVMLIWQSNNSGVSCNQYYQFSSDGGQSWTEPELMLDDLLGCPTGNQLLVGESGHFFLMTSIQSRIYLMAWDGSRWSKPQPQLALSSFVDPNTYRTVDLGCREATLIDGNNLYVIGCDQNLGQDIWVTSRPVADTAVWFSDEPQWSPLLPVVMDQTILTPVMIADANGRLHAFWSQFPPEAGGGPGTGIYYARLDEGQQWTVPQLILASPAGKAEQPAVAIDADGNLLVTWSGGQDGEIYFSLSRANRATLPDAWLDPVLLSSPPAGSWPDLTVDRQGRIVVVYAIPLNEGRGVYLTRSSDGGLTWEEPQMIFDAAAAGWKMVDHPHIQVSSDGVYHMIWTQYSLPGGAGPLGLYYTRSEDEGQEWSEPQLISDKTTEWNRLYASGEGQLNRFWQERSVNQTQIIQEFSSDNGLTWGRLEPISITGNMLGDPVLVEDTAGQFHLLQVVDRGLVDAVLLYWNWDGTEWRSAQSMDLNEIEAVPSSQLAAAVSEAGLNVLLAGKLLDPESGLSQLGYFHTRLEIAVPADAVQTAPEVTPQVLTTPTATSRPTQELEPTPTSAAVSLERLREQPDETADNNRLGIILGPAAAGIIVLLVFVFGVRKVR